MIKKYKEDLILRLKNAQFKINLFIQKKNKKSLTTFIGNFIDKLSYEKIAKNIFILLLFSAIYFWALNPFSQGTNNKDLSFLSSIYFSIITFSSLGYGDISPIGFGRVIASIEILSGLAMTAILVGKIASEKQFAMLRLVYTSEHQKRIVNFQKETIRITKLINKALDNHDHEKLFTLSKKNYRFIASLHNYLKFQSNQGDLATFGNDTALKRLYKSLLKLQMIMNESIKTYGTQQRTRNKFQQIMTRINIMSKMMESFHTRNKKIIIILHEVNNVTENSNKWLENYSNGQVVYKYRSKITEKLLLKVNEKLPLQPWPKHVHKIIASEIEIQNQLVQKCIDVLIQRGI
jgi:hypothetical protein